MASLMLLVAFFLILNCPVLIVSQPFDSEAFSTVIILPTASSTGTVTSISGAIASTKKAIATPTASFHKASASQHGATANSISINGATISATGTNGATFVPTGTQGVTVSPTATTSTNGATVSITGPTPTPTGPGGSQGASTTGSTTLTPTVTPPVVVTCGAQIDPIWRILWPRTSRNSLAMRPCPPQFYGQARRWCNNFGIWGPPNLSNCYSEDIDGLFSQADGFFQDQPDISGALYLAAQLRNISRPGYGMRLLPGDLRSLNDIVRETLRFLRQQGEPGSDQGADIFDTFNNALDPGNKESWLELQDSEAAGSEELLSNAEDYALYLALTINSTSETTLFSRSNIALRAKRFSRSEGEFSNNKFPSESDLVNSSNTDVTNSIIIPGAYLEARANDINAYGEVSVVSMLFSSLQDFLPAGNNDTISSVIISSQVITGNDNTTSGNTTIESILFDSPIELTFAIDLTNVTYNTSTERLSFSCVSWLYSTDFNASSSGGWVTDGIITSQDAINDSVIHCYSYHLTSFAVLVSVVDATTVNSTDPTDIEEQLLSIVSYIGCSISIVCLLVTIACLFTLKKDLIQKPLNLLHLNLSIALLVGLLLFVSGIETAVSIPELCTTITVLMHYFFLAAFSWMLCEAIMLYLLVVIVFSRLIKMWWLYLLIGWGGPLVPLVITLAARFNEYRSDTLCWLNPEHGIIWSFVGPIIGVICVNTVILVVVLIRIGQSLYTKKRRQTITKKSNTETSKKSPNQSTALNIIQGMIFLLPLLGSTWIIGIFAVNENTTVFAWLFVILNSLQGAFIFFFHVFRGPLVWGRFKKWHERNKREKETSTILKRELTTSGMTSTEELEITKF